MRLFFALWPPASVAQALAGHAAMLAKRFGGRATRKETIHLTLAFLGDVDEGQLPAVFDLAREVKATPFELSVDQLGFWRHNRLIWAGSTSTNTPALAELQAMAASLRQRLLAASLPCDASQAFLPHLTLVRKVGDSHPALPGLPAIIWRCDRFVLVRSRLDTGGAGYATVAEFPLAG